MLRVRVNILTHLSFSNIQFIRREEINQIQLKAGQMIDWLFHISLAATIEHHGTILLITMNEADTLLQQFEMPGPP